jgi:hypothetical protein
MANFLSERIKSIIFYPAYEWKIIAAEKRTLKEDFSGYAVKLILIGAAAQAVGSFLFVRNVLDIDAYRFSYPLVKALFYIIMQMLTIFLLTFFINGVAGRFASQKDFIKSGKLVIYALTPFLICYILANLDRRLIIVMIPAFYSLYLFTKGLPVMLKTAPLKVPSFVFIIAITALGINYLLEMGFAFFSALIFPDIIAS